MTDIPQTQQFYDGRGQAYSINETPHKTMRIGQTSVFVAGSKFTGSIVGFFATVYFARVLGESVLGQYALSVTIALWAVLVADVGLSKALTKRVSEGREQEQYITAGFIIAGCIGGVASLALFLLRGPVSDYIGASATSLVIFLLLVKLLNTVVNSSLRGRNLVHVSAIFSILGRIARAGFQISLVVLGFGLFGLLGGHVVAGLTITGIAFLYLNPKFTLPERRHFTSIFKFAKFSWLGNVRSKVVSNVDIAVLGFFVPSGLIGIYSIVWSITMFLDIFGNAIVGSMFPQMSKHSEQGNLNQIGSFIEDALTYSGFLLIPGFIGSLVIGDRLLQVYGPGFVRGTEIIGILIFGILAYSYTKQFLNTLNAVDRPDLAFRANAIFSGMNIMLNIILIYTFGWIGAAAATALSAIVGLGLSFRYAKRIIPFRFPIGEITRQTFAALLMGVIVIIARYLGENHWLSNWNDIFVVVLVLTGATTYFVFLSLISSNFRSTMVQNLPFEDILEKLN